MLNSLLTGHFLTPCRTAVVDSASLPPAVSGRRGVIPKGKQQAWLGKSAWEVGKKRPLGNNGASSQRASKSPVLSEPDPHVAPTQHSANLSAKLAALRTPLIHLLALGPDSEQNLASRTRVSEDVCLRILQKVGNRNLKLWELVDDIYKDLEIWEFPYPTKANRDTAIANCRAAFHRLHLPKDAPEWKKLLGPDGAAVEPSPPPRPPPQVKKPVVKKAAPPPSIKVTGDVKEPSQGSPTSTTVAGKKTSGGEPMSRSASQTATKPRTDAITRIISKKSKKPVAPKARAATIKAPRASVKATKAAAAKEAANAKIKSAERVVDSDEDIEMEDVKPLPPKPLDKKPPPAIKRPTPSPVVKAPRSVSSAAPSDMEVEHTRLKPTKPLPGKVQKGTAKKRAAVPPPRSNNLTATKGSNTSQLPTAKVLKPIQAQEVRRGASNSPSKPSPLGSSPPINASDKSTTASSSPSFRTSIAGTATPGMSPLDPLAQATRASRPRYVPSASPPLKRKAVTDREEPSYSSRPPGRPNTAASSTSSTSTNASVNNNAGSNKRRNTSTIDSATLELAHKFKKDYARYERLYYEAQEMSDKQKQKEKIAVVVALHKNLIQIKAKIEFAASPH